MFHFKQSLVREYLGYQLQFSASGSDQKKCYLALSNVFFHGVKNRHLTCKIHYKSKRIKRVPALILPLKFSPTGATMLTPNSYMQQFTTVTRFVVKQRFQKVTIQCVSRPRVVQTARANTRIMKNLNFLKRKVSKLQLNQNEQDPPVQWIFLFPMPSCRNPYKKKKNSFLKHPQVKIVISKSWRMQNTYTPI